MLESFTQKENLLEKIELTNIENELIFKPKKNKHYSLKSLFTDITWISQIQEINLFQIKAHSNLLYSCLLKEFFDTFLNEENIFYNYSKKTRKNNQEKFRKAIIKEIASLKVRLSAEIYYQVISLNFVYFLFLTDFVYYEQTVIVLIYFISSFYIYILMVFAHLCNKKQKNQIFSLIFMKNCPYFLTMVLTFGWLLFSFYVILQINERNAISSLSDKVNFAFRTLDVFRFFSLFFFLQRFLYSDSLNQNSCFYPDNFRIFLTLTYDLQNLTSILVIIHQHFLEEHYNSSDNIKYLMAIINLFIYLLYFLTISFCFFKKWTANRTYKFHLTIGNYSFCFYILGFLFLSFEFVFFGIFCGLSRMIPMYFGAKGLDYLLSSFLFSNMTYFEIEESKLYSLLRSSFTLFYKKSKKKLD